MMSAQPRNPAPGRMPVFPVACWMLGLMAFAQLLIAGMALTSHLDRSREVRFVNQEVVKPVIINVPQPAAATAQPVVSRPPTSPVPEAPPIVEPTPLAAPQIADPRSERLFKESREARLIHGDMLVAKLKLEEALKQSPDEPALLYELGLVHEEMGVDDTASDYYEKIFQMGTTGAGVFYQMAAAILRDGFNREDETPGIMSLGRVRPFNNPNDEEGHRVILTIPIQKVPDHEVDINNIAVNVEFFNRTDQDEIVPLEDKSWVSDKWITLPFDWEGGEESVRMTYLIPPQDEQDDSWAGKRSYYGYVVSLLYKGEVMDIRASPRSLVARMMRHSPSGGENGYDLPPQSMDLLPPDFDPELPLLPALPDNE